MAPRIPNPGAWGIGWRLRGANLRGLSVDERTTGAFVTGVKEFKNRFYKFSRKTFEHFKLGWNSTTFL